MALTNIPKHLPSKRIKTHIFLQLVQQTGACRQVLKLYRPNCYFGAEGSRVEYSPAILNKMLFTLRSYLLESANSKVQDFVNIMTPPFVFRQQRCNHAIKLINMKHKGCNRYIYIRPELQ